MEKLPLRMIWINVKGAVTDMRYFARSKFSWSLAYKKNISLIWPVVFKLDTYFVVSDNNSRQNCKQAIIKLSLAYSFWKRVFIGQNLTHVHILVSWTFDLLLINSSRCLVFRVYFSPCQRNIVWEWIQTSPETNHEIKANIFTCFWYCCWKNGVL